jgi:putative cell wall-binding protein
VSDAVVAELGGYATGGATRVAGADRYATAAAVSASAFPAGVAIAYVATGSTFPDALAGAAAGAATKGPVLLVPPDQIPTSTANELKRLAPKAVVVLGGTGAVSSSVEQQLAAYSPSVTRLAGSDRTATAVAVSKSIYPNGAGTAYVATGLDFPDALAGGPVAAGAKAPLLLVTRPCVTGAMRAELDRLGATKLVLLGGDHAISGAVASLSPCS